MLGSTGAFGGVGGTAGLIVDVTAAQTSSLSATGNTIRTKDINIAFGAGAVAFGPIQIGGIGSATTHTITNNSASGAYQGILFKGGGSARTLTIAGTGDYISMTGTTLSWIAVPEPTSALAGLLMAGGLPRRRCI